MIIDPAGFDQTQNSYSSLTPGKLFSVFKKLFEQQTNTALKLT